jgi:beta-mannanase
LGTLTGKYDDYLKAFAERLKKVEGPVFLRFAHEMNGNWYPWSGVKIGKDKYVAMYRYVKGAFDEEKADNVKWVFSVNAEDVPEKNNDFLLYYPGERYVDYIGIDGYNWGNTRSWGKWVSFREIFEEPYKEITAHLDKPVLISEFGSTSSGGDKARWIREAMDDMRHMRKVRGFVLFNVDKETDWSFSNDEGAAAELKKQLADPYFLSRPKRQ